MMNRSIHRNQGVRSRILAIVLGLTLSVIGAEENGSMLVVVSEPGNSTYALEFQRQAQAWQELAAKGDMEITIIGLAEVGADGDKPALVKTLNSYPKTGGDLWLVWIGHGSNDGRTANFNLRGPDIDAMAVKELLKPFTRRLMILNLFSASGPFLTELSADNRVIINATRGNERNYSRFGEKFAESIASTDADLDLDGSLSLLEAFLHASAATKAFYEDAQRVIQEHAIIDDNGDGRGTPADGFIGLRAEGPTPDGATAREVDFSLKPPSEPLSPEARDERTKLELGIDALRKRKPELPEDAYYAELEKLMLEMARLYGRKP